MDKKSRKRGQFGIGELMLAMTASGAGLAYFQPSAIEKAHRKTHTAILSKDPQMTAHFLSHYNARTLGLTEFEQMDILYNLVVREPNGPTISEAERLEFFKQAVEQGILDNVAHVQNVMPDLLNSATSKGYTEIVEILLKHGAKPSPETTEGEAPETTTQIMHIHPHTSNAPMHAV